MEEEEKILAIVYKYYPKNIESCTDIYYESLEFKRLKNTLKQEHKKLTNWSSFLESLKSKLSSEYKVNDWTQFFNNDASYVCRISCLKSSSKGSISINWVINISVISNYYAIYQSTIESIGEFNMPSYIEYNDFEIPKEISDILFRELKFYFGKWEKFPNHLALKIVPNITVGIKNFGETTYFDCIFTSHIW